MTPPACTPFPGTLTRSRHACLLSALWPHPGPSAPSLGKAQMPQGQGLGCMCLRVHWAVHWGSPRCRVALRQPEHRARVFQTWCLSGTWT